MVSKFALCAFLPCVDSAHSVDGTSGELGGGPLDGDLYEGGYLFKKPMNASARDKLGWRKRWVALAKIGDDDLFLRWYDSRPDDLKTQPKGSLNLRSCTIETLEDKNTSKYIFEIKSAARGEKRVFYATSAKACKMWVEGLNTAVSERRASTGTADGWLWKRGSGKGVGGKRNWKKRYFVLHPGAHTMDYFVAPDEKVKKGSVNLAGATIRLLHRKEKNDAFHFEIVDGEGAVKEYYAENFLVRKRFVDAIRSVSGVQAGTMLTAEGKGQELRAHQAVSESVGAPSAVDSSPNRKHRAKLLSKSMSGSSSHVGDALKVGFLMKKGGGTSILGRRSWKKRFFRLTAGTIVYYKNDKAKKPQGMIPIDGCIVSTPENKKYETYFCVTRGSEKLELRAQDLDGVASWGVAIEDAVKEFSVPH